MFTSHVELLNLRDFAPTELPKSRRREGKERKVCSWQEGKRFFHEYNLRASQNLSNKQTNEQQSNLAARSSVFALASRSDIKNGSSAAERMTRVELETKSFFTSGNGKRVAISNAISDFSSWNNWAILSNGEEGF